MKYVAVTIIGMMVIGGCITLHCTDHHAEPETAPAYDNLVLDDLVVEVPQKMLVSGKFQRETQRTRVWIRSGMPCDLYNAESNTFNTLDALEPTERMLDEQETSEESEVDRDLQGYRPDDEIDAQAIPESDSTVVEKETQEVLAVQTVVPEVPPSTGQSETAYGLDEYLRMALESAGIGWWYPYGCAQITQESHWNPNAISDDGLDYGVLQFRKQYWGGPEDIMDPYAQIRVYVSNTQRRISSGLSIEEVISRHNTSDWVTEINWEYVRLVLQYLQ